MSAHERDILHEVRGAMPMSDTVEVIDSTSFARFNWDVVTRWLGMADGRHYTAPADCFCNNASCQTVLVRNPFARPLTKSDAGPVRTDRDAGHPDGDGSDQDAGSDANAQPTGGDVAGRAGDGDGSGHADYLRANDGDTGGAQDVLLGGRAALTNADADVSPVRDTSAGNAMHEGVLT